MFSLWQWIIILILIILCFIFCIKKPTLAYIICVLMFLSQIYVLLSGLRGEWLGLGLKLKYEVIDVVFYYIILLSTVRYATVIVPMFVNERKRKAQMKYYAGVDLSYVDNMDGHSFEYWCASLLQDNGFKNVRVTPGSGDQGVDIIGERDGAWYAVQCKRHSQPLNNKPIQEVYTGKEIYHCNYAIVMTNNYFTHSAVDAANATGVLLWDRKRLAELERIRKTDTDYTPMF